MKAENQESPYVYFLRVLNAKRKHEEWVKGIPIDNNVILAHEDKIEHLRGPFKKQDMPW